MSINDNDNNIWSGLLPKNETQAYDFVKNNPTFDGRGIIVGILDTGVDPGAIGLSTTTDGKPKVIDVIDCSGSGDVLMSAPVKCTAEGYISTFGDRQLKINKEWVNPSGEFRTGIKRVSDLLPRDLKPRLKEERKKELEKEFRTAEIALQKFLIETTTNSTPSTTTGNDAVEDAKTRIQLLKACEKDLDEPGPVYDCIVFHDGTHWQAAVDTTGTGDFTNAVVMTDYHIHLQYSKFSQSDNCNYCVNIFDEGSILSIVVDAGAHGSHVAGIVAAHHPDQPECNGVAPGAQIISLKIGDSRLGSMETGSGLTRALIEAVKLGCHIINMSYGEATATSNLGAFAKLTDDLVKKHGIIYVSSAGNNGPGLSTVGCPGGTTSSCIGVGAFVTHSLMNSAYSMLETTPETNYTWSSMGPTLDGEIGVSIIAPGGAVTSVPTWTLNKKQLMNGTSMSSPNACGCITLLLSAARASNLPTTPVSVRRALENSAKFIPNVHVLGQGYGLVQVERAWEYLNATSDDTNKDISYKVSFNHPGFSNGIYLRQPNEANTANTYVATIDPEFPHNCSLDVKSNFEMRLELESTADWITIPKNVLLLQNGKQVSIFVDPRALPTGVHVEFVRVFDTSRQRSLGPILLIPVTVVRPIIVPSGAVSLDLGTLDLTPGERRRKYIVIPHGCTYIDCRVTDPREPTRSQGADADGDTDVDADPQSLSPDTVPTSVTSTATTATTTSLASAADDGARMIVLHALQLFKGTPYRDNEMHIYKNLTPGSEHVVSWAVHEEVTMELVVGRAWGCIGDTSCSVTLFFRGVLPSPSQLVLTAGQRVSSIVRIFAPLGTTEIAPEGKLTKWLSTIKSTSSKVSPLGERDVLPDGTSVYQLVIEYEIDLSEACDIIPRFPGLQGVLYESNFMSQFVMVYNSKKVLVGSGDAWPSSIKVTKGKYTVRLQVRHTSTTVLEGLSDLPLVLERSPKSSIPLSFYHTQTDAMAGSDGKFGSRVLHVGNSASFFVREPTADSLPKSVATGDVFVGSVTYVKKSASTIGSTDRPGGYPIRYTYVDTKSKAVSTTSTPSASASGESEKSLETLVKDVKIKYLKGLVGNETAFLAALDTVKAEFPDDLQVRLCAINHGDKLLVTEVTKAGKLRVENDSSINSKISQEIASLNKCIDLARISVNECTAIFPLINRDEIALELGKNLDKDNAAAVAARKEIDSKKSVLCEALHVRAKTYLHWINSVERLTVLAASPSDLPVESSAVPVTAATDSVTDGTVEALPTTTTAAPTASGTDTTVATLKEEFTAAYKELLVWDDGSAEKYATLQIARYLMQGHTGLALKKINDVLGTSEGKLTPVVRDSLMADREECWAQLGLGVVATASRNWKLLAARDGFEPF